MDRRRVVALDEALSPLAVLSAKVEPAGLARQLAELRESRLLPSLDERHASFAAQVLDRHDPAFFGLCDFGHCRIIRDRLAFRDIGERLSDRFRQLVATLQVGGELIPRPLPPSAAVIEMEEGAPLFRLQMLPPAIAACWSCGAALSLRL
jgi:hypothetical protein